MQAHVILPPLILTRDEQQQLDQWVRNGLMAERLVMRARIVRCCQAGCSNLDCAKQLKITPQTVGKWRARFVAQRMQGLADLPRSGAPRLIGDSLVEAVLVKTLHEQTPDGARWSSRRLAVALGVSQRTVLRIWRTFEL